jgi:hypothetical protein
MEISIKVTRVLKLVEKVQNLTKTVTSGLGNSDPNILAINIYLLNKLDAKYLCLVAIIKCRILATLRITLHP